MSTVNNRYNDNRNGRTDRNNRKRKKEEKVFDIFAVIRYLAMSILFSVIIWGMKLIVLAATAASPTGQVGNGMLTLYEVQNTGAAFSLFKDQQEMIIMASFLAVAVIAFVVIVTSAKLTQAAISSMSLLSAGIIMNMSERLSQGYVIDYIHCDFLPNFPVFNMADIMIVLGALGLIWTVIAKR